MPSSTLERVRKQYPQLADVDDRNLTVRLGNKYPKLLQEDEEFRSDFEEYTTVSTGDRMRQAYGSFVKSFTDTGLGLPESISIAAAQMGGGVLGGPETPEDTVTGAFVKMMREDVVPAVTPEFSDEEQRQMGDEFLATQLPSALGSGIGFILGGLGIKTLIEGGIKKGTKELGEH